MNKTNFTQFLFNACRRLGRYITVPTYTVDCVFPFLKFYLFLSLFTGNDFRRMSKAHAGFDTFVMPNNYGSNNRLELY